MYKETQFDLEEQIQQSSRLSKEQTQKILQRNKKKLPLPKLPTRDLSEKNYHLIDGAFDLKAQDQGRRPTCASFAGVRALEVLLNKQGNPHLLSKQYFYYLSKPKCQKAPCTRRGSWPLSAYRASQKASSPNIPLEKDCPYTDRALINNETQIPLSANCKRGFAKVQSFENLTSTREIYDFLDRDYPVIVGLKLSSSFYQNRGFVGLTTRSKAKLDSHAGGHAVLLVGYMNLPKEKHASEGSRCFLSTNSWGEGWGLGGHSCLSEKWLQKHLINKAIMAPTKLTTI